MWKLFLFVAWVFFSSNYATAATTTATVPTATTAATTTTTVGSGDTNRIVIGTEYKEYYDLFTKTKHAAVEVRKYFDFVLVSENQTNTEIERVDLFADFYSHKLWNIMSKRSTVPATWTSRRLDLKNIDLFGVKSNWIDWMKTIGLGNFVPKKYNYYKEASFPALFKLPHEHASNGVKVVNSMAELEKEIADYSAKYKDDPNHIPQWHVEEALTGMGNKEGYITAAAYNGELLTLVCDVRESDVVQSGGKELFIFQKGSKLGNRQFVKCGTKLVGAISLMVKKSNYTGHLCSNMKADSSGHVKMIDVNARMCGSQTYTPRLFIEAYVALAFRVLQDVREHSISSPKAPPWTTNEMIVKMGKHADAALRRNEGKHRYVDYVPE